jgi:putative endonuclease
MEKVFCAYIATNKNNTVFYTGMTSNLAGRIFQHKNKEVEGFTKKYNIDKLVFYKNFSTAMDAITAEKRIKGWTRQKKIDLIKKDNPEFKDLLADYF